MKTVRTLSIAILCVLSMLFSCCHYGDNPFESNGGKWDSFYSDTVGNRIDFAPISSSTQYNPITFKNGRLEESSYLGFVIDTGTTNYNSCGNKLTVRTNLSISSEPSGYLDFNIVHLSKDSIVLQTSITGVTFIKYYTIVR